MTPEGKRKLEERLKYLKSVERPQNIADIERARGLGDLSENADYDAAKNKQGLIAAELNDIEHKLSLSQVIDPATIKSEKIVFGATVTLKDLDSDDKITYSIVGTVESDIQKGKISIESPIARGLIGKQEGDEVKIKTPKGLREFQIIRIVYQ
ncbi:MAG: transcription elongation factor GreA [Deltaproteobacteria bacterium]|nr:transcription elongation factor GreA [Deltaproteobacteria bacterium]